MTKDNIVYIENNQFITINGSPMNTDNNPVKITIVGPEIPFDFDNNRDSNKSLIDYNEETDTWTSRPIYEVKSGWFKNGYDITSVIIDKFTDGSISFDKSDMSKIIESINY